jgi:ABC-type nitrate/sulfonate/bicarbonate transport system permease component
MFLSRVGDSPALLGLLGLGVFAALLEILPRAGVLNPEYFPPTSRIIGALWQELGRPDQPFKPSLLSALGDTLVTWLTGLAIAVSAGVVVGVIIGAVPLLREFTASTIEFLRPIPSVALIPGLIVLLGVGREPTLVIVVYASFWQVLVQVLYGVADVDPVARDTARSYHLGPLRRVRYVIWPTALPYVMTGIRLATTVALIVTITGEMVIGTPGLGDNLFVAYTGGDVPVMYALILVTGLIGVVANSITRAGERIVLRWHPSVRGEVAV